MRRQVWIFVGRTYHSVVNLMSRLNYITYWLFAYYCRLLIHVTFAKRRAWSGSKLPEKITKHDILHNRKRAWLTDLFTCFKRPLIRKQKIGFQDRFLLNAYQKYCRMLQEHSAILSTFIKVPFVIKILVLYIFEWPYCILKKFGWGRHVQLSLLPMLVIGK